MTVMQCSSDCGVAFRLPASRRRPLFPSLSLLFVSWPTSVLRAIPYYAALHCHNPYITCRSDESEFMVQGAPSASRISENFSEKKHSPGTHRRPRVAPARLSAATDFYFSKFPNKNRPANRQRSFRERENTIVPG